MQVLTSCAREALHCVDCFNSSCCSSSNSSSSSSSSLQFKMNPEAAIVNFYTERFISPSTSVGHVIMHDTVHRYWVTLTTLKKHRKLRL